MVNFNIFILQIKTLNYGDCEIIQEVKIIDFGSSFASDRMNNGVSFIVPEYMPPELLNF